MTSERSQTAERRSRWPRGCLIPPAVCAIALMTSVLGIALVQSRNGALPELSGQLGGYRLVAYTTVVPTCSPALPCRQQFADVPLPRYYVIWVVPQHTPHAPGTRLLTIPLTLPR